MTPYNLLDKIVSEKLSDSSSKVEKYVINPYADNPPLFYCKISLLLPHSGSKVYHRNNTDSQFSTSIVRALH